MEEENKNPASTQEGTTGNQNPPENQSSNSTNEGAAEGANHENAENQSSNDEASQNENKPEAQSKEENAKFAQMRHQKEVLKAKAAGDAEGYKRARIKSVGGKNPYANNSPIETDEDYLLYEIQDEIKQNGGDPNNILEVDKLRRQKQAEAQKALDEAKSTEEKNQERANQEVQDYLKSGHTQEELKSYWANPTFQEFASDLLGVIPLSSIISKFDKAYPKKNTNEGKEKVAKQVSNPGGAANNESTPPAKTISQMSQEEFKKLYDEVKAGKRKL